MNDYIKREAAIDLITSRYECPEICAAEIKAIPAADVEPVEHGRWNDFYGDYKVAKCSKCSEEYEVSDTNAGLAILFKAFKEYYKFCPNCGARMDGEEDG